MIYTPLTKRALKLCYEAHQGQVDKSGLPYVFHPFHLAEQMDSEETVIVALLHDVVEDTPYTLEELGGMGFPPSVLRALTLLTHDKETPYMEYVAALREDPIARVVKLADLRHNSDLSRLDAVTEEERRRVEKYARAIELLEKGSGEPVGRGILDAPRHDRRVDEDIGSCDLNGGVGVEGSPTHAKNF